MSPKYPKGARNRIELLRLFDVVMRHYGHGIDARREAWQVALQHPYRAWVCYSAIARSLDV